MMELYTGIIQSNSKTTLNSERKAMVYPSKSQKNTQGILREYSLNIRLLIYEISLKTEKRHAQQPSKAKKMREIFAVIFWTN